MDKQSFFTALQPLFRSVGRPQELTLGVEQEFFLCDQAGRPANHRQSQGFLESFHRDCQGILTEEDDTGIGRHVACADVLLSGQRVRFKYDHHPHVMEIELPPVATVQQIYELLAPAMEIASGQAEKLGLAARFEPFLPEPVDHAAIASEHSLCVALREYRKLVNADRPEITANPQWMNFSAYIAATHFHLGGVGWGELQAVINGLYCLEPGVTPFSWQYVAENHRNALQKRWQGYWTCLGRLPLVAFPDLEAWTLDSWFNALCRMPLAETPDNHCGGEVDHHDPLAWFRAARDVSLIKPRHYGTVEFRCDPCQPTAWAVAELVALRLGLVVEILRGRVPPRSFREARNLWISSLDTIG